MNTKPILIILGFALILTLAEAQINEGPVPSLSNAAETTGISDSMAEAIPAKNCTRPLIAASITNAQEYTAQFRSQANYNMTKKYCRDNEMYIEQGLNITYDISRCVTVSLTPMPSITATDPNIMALTTQAAIEDCNENSPAPTYDTGVSIGGMG